MSFYFKIISPFDLNSIRISTISNNKNLKFQYYIETNKEFSLDDFDCGQFFVSELNPTIETDGLTIYNPFSCGFLSNTGQILTVKNYIGTTAGVITFLPENQLAKIAFTPSIKDKNARNIRIYENNKITNKYLTQNVDDNYFYFLTIENLSKLSDEFNCDWFIEIINKDASTV